MRKVKSHLVQNLLWDFSALKKSPCGDCKNLGLGGAPIAQTLQAYLTGKQEELPDEDFIWLTEDAVRWVIFISVATNKKIFDTDNKIV